MEKEDFFSEKYIITSDCIFEAARKPHKTCQDYSICGDQPFPFLIISDGCGGSDNTDIGSRILSHVAKTNLKFLEKEDIDISASIIYNSENAIRNMDLNQSCLDATLIIVYILNNIVYIKMYGDGHIFIVNKKGEIRLHKTVSYNSNAPYYLSYKLDQKRDSSYKMSQEQEKDSIGKVTISGKDFDQYSFPITMFYKNITQRDLDDDVEFIIITSDGIDSFYDLRKAEKIPSSEIIKEIIGFKSKNGDFVKRRIRRMLSDFEAKEIYNSDDLSVAAFMIRENK